MSTTPLGFDSNGSILTFCGTRLSTRTRVDGHVGYDWIMPEGTPVLAAADGDVYQAGTSPPFYCPPLDRVVDDNLYVGLRHQGPGGEVLFTQHAHLSGIGVAVWQHVRSGEVVGLSGNSGCSLRPHLHFEVGRVRGSRAIFFDPYGWQSDEADPWARHPEGYGERMVVEARPGSRAGPLTRARVAASRERPAGRAAPRNPEHDLGL